VAFLISRRDVMATFEQFLQDHQMEVDKALARFDKVSSLTQSLVDSV
jgi:hypothetical protein